MCSSSSSSSSAVGVAESHACVHTPMRQAVQYVVVVVMCSSSSSSSNGSSSSAELTTVGVAEPRVSVHAPLRQRVQCHKVDFKLTVGIGQNAAGVLNNTRIAARVWAEVEACLIVIVSM